MNVPVPEVAVTNNNVREGPACYDVEDEYNVTTFTGFNKSAKKSRVAK